MPRPMLKTPQKQVQSNHLLSASYQAQQKQNRQMDKMKLDRLLRKPRSKEYIDAIRRLDAGGHVHNHKQVEEMIHALQKEFPEIEIQAVLLGCVAVCHLGEPYEVHTLDLTNGIIEHYKKGQMLPNGLEKARSIAMRGGYAVIEVYIDCCRAISSTGAVYTVGFLFR